MLQVTRTELELIGTVEKGPSKFDLMTALFVTKGSDCNPVKFKVNGGGWTIRILGISRADEGFESWIINGMVRLEGGGEDHVEINFDTQSRKGEIFKVFSF